MIGIHKFTKMIPKQTIPNNRTVILSMEHSITPRETEIENVKAA